jgi:hypothetical protein
MISQYPCFALMSDTNLRMSIEIVMITTTRARRMIEPCEDDLRSNSVVRHCELKKFGGSLRRFVKRCN